MLPATRNSRPLVRIPLPLTLPLASGPSSVTPVPFIAPLLQLRLFVSVRVAVPPNVPVPLSVRPAALLVPLMFNVPPLTASVGKVVVDCVAIVSVTLLLSRVPPLPRLPLAIVPVPPAFSRVAPLLTVKLAPLDVPEVEIPLNVSVPAFTCSAPVFTRPKVPATVLLPVFTSVPALLIVSAWQQPFQLRLVVLFPTVSVPPATVLRLAAPPWLFWMSVASTVTLPAARSSCEPVSTTLPVTVPVLPDAP